MEPRLTQPPCRLSDERKSVVGQGLCGSRREGRVGRRERFSSPAGKRFRLPRRRRADRIRGHAPHSLALSLAGPDSTRACFYALGANAAIAVAKYAAAAVTGSGSMAAEAVHSTADCGNQLLLLLGLRRSKRAPDREHPLGFGKETYFWSF